MTKPIYIKHAEIDKKKWDHLIKVSKQSMIYAESVYLDYMAGEWDALILGDYVAVMPLCFRKKWGIRYLYQPAFIQQGGIFSTMEIDSKILESFLQICKEHFLFAEINMNFGNEMIIEMSGKQMISRLCNNYLLVMSDSYKNISSNYQPYFAERICKAEKNQFIYNRQDSIMEATQLFKSLYARRMKGVSESDWINFNKLCLHYDNDHRVIVRSVKSPHSNDVLAMILLLKDDHRIYNMMSSVTENGKKLLANYFLYDQVIHEFSGKGLIFDFEGSDIPGVSYFYEKIATHNQSYYFLKYNHLPLPLKILKN